MSRLVIDATTAQHARGGIGVVTSGLLNGLAALGASDVGVIAGPDVAVPPPLRAIRPRGLHRTAARIAFQRLVLPAFTAIDPPQRLLLMDSYVPLWRFPGGPTRLESF